MRLLDFACFEIGNCFYGQFASYDGEWKIIWMNGASEVRDVGEGRAWFLSNIEFRRRD